MAVFGLDGEELALISDITLFPVEKPLIPSQPLQDGSTLV
jgi:hypothetical protein